MSHYKPYPAYKDSGVEWLGGVPEHWSIRSFKHLANIRYGIGEPPAYKPEGTPLIRATNVDAGCIRVDGLVYVDPADIPEKRIVWLAPGDIIVVRSGAYTGDSAIIRDEHCPSIAGFDMVARAHGVSPDFLQYALLSEYLKSNQIDLEKMRAAQPHLNAEELGACFVLVPPIQEQRELVDFLDQATKRIDALVEKKTRFIELLREKRQALITHAVTKGLDPTVKMKGSGVEWLGAVPEHWDVVQLRHKAKLESGHTPSRSHPEYWIDCDTPWFTLADVWQVRSGEAKFVYDTSEKVSQLGLEKSSARLLPAGSVFLSRTASVGFSGIMGVDMATSQDFAVWTCDNSLNNEFLYYILRGMKGEFDRLMMGSTHKTIYMPDIEALRVARPPLEEQKLIVEFLSVQFQALSKIIDKSELSLSLLKERRSALITAAVTGQIDLRERYEPRPQHPLFSGFSKVLRTAS